MTTELVLLMSAFAFLLMGIFLQVPEETFFESGPKLGARIEQQLSTGMGFKVKGSESAWQDPNR